MNSLPFVLDASVTVGWLLLDTDHPTVLTALERIESDEAVVPAIWWYEVRNALLVAEARKRILPPDTSRLVRRLETFPIAIEAPDGERTFVLARNHKLSFYDASYLELASRLQHPLATVDRALVSAARGEGVILIAMAE